VSEPSPAPRRKSDDSSRRSSPSAEACASPGARGGSCGASPLMMGARVTLISCCARVEAGRSPTAASASFWLGGGGGCALMICSHFGQRTLNGRAGIFASSNCKRVVQFGQVTIIILEA
jgi:hypothetical protein